MTPVVDLSMIDGYRIDARQGQRLIAWALLDGFGWSVHAHITDARGVPKVRTVCRIDRSRVPAGDRERAVRCLHRLALARSTAPG